MHGLTAYCTQQGCGPVEIGKQTLHPIFNIQTYNFPCGVALHFLVILVIVVLFVCFSISCTTPNLVNTVQICASYQEEEERHLKPAPGVRELRKGVMREELLCEGGCGTFFSVTNSERDNQLFLRGRNRAVDFDGKS